MSIQPLAVPTRIFGEPTAVAPDMNEVVDKVNELVVATNAGLATSNAIVGGFKCVRYTSSQYYGVPADALTLDRLDPATILPGNLAVVINPAATPLTATEPPQPYQALPVASGTAGAVQVPAYSGAPAGTTVFIAWQKARTAADFSPLLVSEVPAGKEPFTGIDLRPLLIAIVAALGSANTITIAPAPSVQPAAPTSPLVDDTANTFSGLAVSGFASYLEYEGIGFPLTSGWVPLTAVNAYQVNNRLYLQGLTGAIAAGGVGLRVAASGSRPAGKPLLSDKDFTGPPPNQLPVANAGADLTITLPTSSVQLMGSGTDADGTIVSQQWSQRIGPSTAVLATPTLMNTAVSGLVAGIYYFRLTVTDDKNGSKDDDVMVTVNAQPAPTITDFSPTSGAVGSSVLVTGTGFGASQGSSTVSVNGVQVASVASWSDTNVRFAVPAGASTGKITLTTAAATAVSGSDFTVTASTSPRVLTPTNSDYSFNMFEGTDYQSVHSDLGFATSDSYVDVPMKATKPNVDPDPYGIGLYKGNDLIKYYLSPGPGVNTLRVDLPYGGSTRTTYSLRLGVQEGNEEGIPLGYSTIQSLSFPTDALASFVKFANTDDVAYFQTDSIGASVWASNLDKHYIAELRRLRPELSIYSAGCGYKFLSYAFATDAQIEAECQRVLKAWGNAKKRRYILALGTNDMGRGLDPSLVMSYAKKVLKRLLALAPDAMLYVQLVLDYGTYASKAYRKAALALQDNELPNLRFLDPGLPPLADTLHPNDTGYAQLAQRDHAQLDLPPTAVPKPPTRPKSNFTDADLAPMFYSDSLNGYVVKPHADGSDYTENYTVGGLTSKYMPAGQECEIILRAQYGLGNVVIGVRKVAQAPTKYQDIDYGVLIGDQDQKLYTSALGSLQPVGPMGDGNYAKFRRAANGALSVLTSTDNITYTPIGSKFDGVSDASDLFICFVAQDNGTTALLSADCFNCATR